MFLLRYVGLPIISVHKTTVQVLGFLLGKVRNSKKSESRGDNAVLQGWSAGMTSEKGISYLSEFDLESRLIHDEAGD